MTAGAISTSGDGSAVRSTGVEGCRFAASCKPFESVSVFGGVGNLTGSSFFGASTSIGASPFSFFSSTGLSDCLGADDVPFAGAVMIGFGGIRGETGSGLGGSDAERPGIPEDGDL